ncbi:MAG: YjfI family protein [Luteimonas sp.]
MPRLTTHDLHALLAERHAGSTAMTIELIDAAEPAINLVLHDYGDMEVQIAASGAQVFVSTVLAPADRVSDRAGLNDACMRLNPLNPLSNLGLMHSDGQDLYVVFGELSSSSEIEQIDEEIQALADNTIAAVESLKPFFR